MNEDTPTHPGSSDHEELNDRRKPVARYVEFGAEDVQERFIEAAEAAFGRLVAADSFGGLAEVQLQTGPPPKRRGLLRRPQPARSEVVSTTPALAKIAAATSRMPSEVKSSPNGCTSTAQVAQLLAEVTTDLVRDLLQLSPTEQAAHAAYRQTLRLGSELEGLSATVNQVKCTDPDACVGIRSPEHWGRRAEDVEVAEVRAVLLRLALAGKSMREDR